MNLLNKKTKKVVISTLLSISTLTITLFSPVFINSNVNARTMDKADSHFQSLIPDARSKYPTSVILAVNAEVKLNVGDTFDPEAQIRGAYDAADGTDLTNNILISNLPNTNKKGIYYVTYSVKDPVNGYVSTANCRVVVGIKDDELRDYSNPSSDANNSQTNLSQSPKIQSSNTTQSPKKQNIFTTIRSILKSSRN